MSNIHSLALTRAHRFAQKIFLEQFTDIARTPTGEKIIAESNEQISMAGAALDELDQLDVDSITSHFACHILLNISVRYVEKLAKQGLIPEKEASDLLEDLDEYVGRLLDCHKFKCRKTSRSSLFSENQGEASGLSSPLLGN